MTARGTVYQEKCIESWSFEILMIKIVTFFVKFPSCRSRERIRCLKTRFGKQLSSFLPHQEERANKNGEKKKGSSEGETFNNLECAAANDSVRLVHADSRSELVCCKALGANGGSGTITKCRRLFHRERAMVVFACCELRIPQGLEVPRRYYLAPMVHSELFYAIHSIVAA